MKPGRRARRFNAIERSAVDRVGFKWEARFAIAALFSMRVSDRYSDSEGMLRVRALGIPKRIGPL